LKFEYSGKQIRCYVSRLHSDLCCFQLEVRVRLGKIFCFWHAVFHDMGICSTNTMQKLGKTVSTLHGPHRTCSQKFILYLESVSFSLYWEPIIPCWEGAASIYTTNRTGKILSTSLSNFCSTLLCGTTV